MPKKDNLAKSMALGSSILSSLVGSVLVGIFLGSWLDEKTSLSPLFLIIGMIFGLGTGVYGTVRLIEDFDKKSR